MSDIAPRDHIIYQDVEGTCDRKPLRTQCRFHTPNCTGGIRWEARSQNEAAVGGAARGATLPLSHRFEATAGATMIEQCRNTATIDALHIGSYCNHEISIDLDIVLKTFT